MVLVLGQRCCIQRRPRPWLAGLHQKRTAGPLLMGRGWKRGGVVKPRLPWRGQVQSYRARSALGELLQDVGQDAAAPVVLGFHWSIDACAHFEFLVSG